MFIYIYVEAKVKIILNISRQPGSHQRKDILSSTIDCQQSTLPGLNPIVKVLDEYKNKYEYKVDEYSDGISLLMMLMTVVPIRLKNQIDLNCDDYEDHNHNFDVGDDDGDDNDYTYIM